MFEVDKLADSAGGACTAAPSDCTLRDALTLANGTGEADEVSFGVAGTIEPATPLPALTNPVVVDAKTAPGYGGAPVVTLDGTVIPEGEGSRGLEITEGAGGSRIEGLAIGGFRMGVFAYSETPSHICANYIGVLPDGQTELPNRYAGISTGSVGKGIRIGAECGEGNLISGNTEFGILEAGEDTLIKGNSIGVDADGDPLPNGDELLVSAGIEVNAAAVNPVIGGTGPGEGNVIVNTAGPGIRVRKNASNVSIRANSIYANEDAGIEFSEGDPDFSTFVEAFAGSTWFGWLKDLAPNAEFEVDLFTNESCDPSYKGEGQFYLGSDAVETDAGGEVEWAIDVGSQLAGIDAESFSATITSKATGQTSQFSSCSFTRPDTTLETTPPALTAESSAIFEFSGADLGHVHHFQCYIDNEPGEFCSSPHQLSGLADGSHTFEVTAFDGSGFFTIPAPSYTWTVDTTAPKASIDGGPAAETTSTDAQLSFSASDATAGVEALECSLDGGAFVACESPRQLTGLGPGSHSFAVRAVDKAGNQGSAASYAWRVEPPPGEPPPAAAEPEFRESVAVAPASGTVFVTRPGQGRVELKGGETIPVGSIVDATNGKVTLTSVNRAGEVQTAVFYGGRFQVAEQERSGLVVLELRGALRCGPSGSVATASGRKGRRLWGSGKGRFRTEGNYGSATVRGTIWLTEDRCNGTFFKVRRGVVTVRDFPRDRTLALPAGKSYLAKTPG